MRKKLLLVLIPIIVLLGCCIAALCIISFEPKEELYLQNVAYAANYLENKDYDNAIIYYQYALEADNTQEEPYLRLAEIYYTQGRVEDAVAILQMGVTYSNTAEIQNMLAIYIDIQNGGLGETGADDIEKKDDVIENMGAFNSTLLTVFSSCTYSDYSQRYTVSNESFAGGKYTVRYLNYNMDFIYYNDTVNSNVLDAQTGKPNENSKPSEISVENLDEVISGASSGVTGDDLKRKGATNVIKSYDPGLKSDVLTFKYMNCSFTIACNEDGVISGSDAYNKIVPEQNTDLYEKVQVSGKVIGATDAKPVGDAELLFRSGSNNRSGDVSATFRTGSDGVYSVELLPGEYTVEIAAESFNTEYFSVTVIEETPLSKDFSISPTLDSGEIRIVLEWGSMPRDLDSHLTGTTGSGQQVNVNFVTKTVRVGSEIIAKLDVDDTSSFGPETTTISDTTGSYEFRVHNYSGDGSLATSGATVKVYVSGDSQPTVIQVPDDVQGDWWSVFKIEDGQIVDVNGKT